MEMEVLNRKQKIYISAKDIENNLKKSLENTFSRTQWTKKLYQKLESTLLIFLAQFTVF